MQFTIDIVGVLSNLYYWYWWDIFLLLFPWWSQCSGCPTIGHSICFCGRVRQRKPPSTKQLKHNHSLYLFPNIIDSCQPNTITRALPKAAALCLLSGRLRQISMLWFQCDWRCCFPFVTCYDLGILLTSFWCSDHMIVTSPFHFKPLKGELFLLFSFFGVVVVVACWCWCGR